MNQIKISKFWVGPKDPNRTRYETDGAISLRDPHGVLAFIKKYSWRLISLCLSRGGRSISTTIRLYHNFGLHLLKLNKFHGEVFVVKYLKACQLAVQKKVAGQPLKSLRDLEPDLPLPRLSKSGLPNVIGLKHRRAICSDAFGPIRLWLTLFSIYRVIKIPGKLKLETITASFSGNSSGLGLIESWMELNAPKLIHVSLTPRSISGAEILPIEKSSPSSGTSWEGLITDGVGIGQSKIFKAFSDYCKLTDNMYILNWIIQINQAFVNNAEALERLPCKPSIDSPWLSNGKNIPLGQLAFKEEAAGKVRVFAMVDIWTQSLLRPLHDGIFNILKSLPNDGTFDQEASFARCIKKSKISHVAYGYDLSAATDRLPLSLQIAILSSFLGKRVAEAWGTILVGRAYIIPEKGKDFGLTPGSEMYYAVGQPMGALSSWGMLALTHHLIVQYCYWTLHKASDLKWFEGYEVLGDDIQIFDSDVAAKYLEVCDILGVSINLSKSVVSTRLVPVVEYAKKTAVLEKDVSALSWKMVASQDNAPGRVQLALKVWQKGFVKSLMTTFALTTGKNRHVKVKNLAYPIISLYTSLFKQGKVSWEWLLERLASPTEFDILYGSGMLPKVSRKEAEKVIAAISAGEDPSRAVSADIEREATVLIHYVEQTEFVLRRRIMKLQSLLVSDKFTHHMVETIKSRLLLDRTKEYVNESNSSTLSKIRFVVDGLVWDLVLDRYYNKLEKLFAVDLELLRLSELFTYLDKLEAERRVFELGIRATVERKEAVKSDLYVLRNLSEITRLNKTKRVW